ncbi:MAG: hypothetical protein IIB54_15125, partial [Planctomycetes bacterium]|nr:hypothetical protein [Planctomycetota bacterium]
RLLLIEKTYYNFDQFNPITIAEYSFINPTYALDDFPGILIFEHRLDDDEPVVMIAPYLAVFDDEQFREFSDPASWTDSGGFDTYRKDLRRYLNQNANRIHFNSYTGVAMR